MLKLGLTPAAGIRVAANIIILGMALTSTGCATSTRTAYAPAGLENQATAAPRRTSDSTGDGSVTSSPWVSEPGASHSASGLSTQPAVVPWTAQSADVPVTAWSQDQTRQVAAESTQTASSPDRTSTDSSSDSPAAPASASAARLIDPGAAAIASAMRQALNQHLPGSSEPAIVVFGRFRNQSRASADEFAAVVDDLRSALTAAAAQQSIACIDDALTPTPYELEATIYLLRDGVIDSWEIFLTLRQRTGTVLWESDGPVRMQRAREADYRQLVYPAKPRK